MRYERTILWLVGLVVGAGLIAIGFLKYYLFLYDGIDLAYFTQVFWYFVHGSAWTQTIHPHASLGDHAELVIPLLVPFFALWQDARMLIVMQVVAVLVPAFPVYWISCTIAHSPALRRFPFLMTLVYLLNPLVHNMAVYEFHVLVFAIFPLMLAVLGFVRGDRRMFLLACLGAILVREDVAIVVLGFGLLAFIYRREWWWRVVPVVIGVGWFVVAMSIVRAFSLGGGYKFLVYYRWIWDALREPMVFVWHFLTSANLEMVLAMLMSVALLPVFAVAELVLLLGPLAQILLGAPGGSTVVTSTHYSVLFMPGLMLSAVVGLQTLFVRVQHVHRTVTVFVSGVIIVASLYAMFLVGPWIGAVRLFTDTAILEERESFMRSIEEIPRDAAVVASYRFLPMLAAREHLYSLHYAFLGVTQFAEREYVLPAVDVAVIDRRDFVRYKGQFLQTGWARPFYDGGFERLSGLFESWGREEYGGVEVLEKGGMGIRRGLEKEDVKGEYDFLLGPVGTTKVELRK